MRGVPSDKVPRYLILFAKATLLCVTLPRLLKETLIDSINLLNTFYQFILPGKMYNIVIRSVNADHGQQRPELSPEDQMVSSYLEDRSETYRDLVEEQDDVSDFKFTID